MTQQSNPSGKEIIELLFDVMRKSSALPIRQECFDAFTNGNLADFEARKDNWLKAGPTLLNAAHQHGVIAAAAAKIANAEAKEVTLAPFTSAGTVVRAMCKDKIAALLEQTRMKRRDVDEDDFRSRGEWCTWP